MVTMPFGKWKGCPLDEIEDSYLEWALTIVTSPWLREAIEEELWHRDEEAEAERESTRGPTPPPPPEPPRPSTDGLTTEKVLALIGSGRRLLATKYHPDKGANGDLMKGINMMADWLQKAVRPNT